jgi:N-acetylglucosaminyldiphosphoundecaprenol N-acetyl-beta-D-mannosaminyltransferase
LRPEDEITWIDVLGQRISRVDREETMRLLLRFIESGEPHLVVTADASSHVIASRDPEFHAIASRADLVTPDGTGILWAARRLGTPLKERVSGVEISERLCAASAKHGFSLYFYGAAPGVAEEAADRMRERYPGARIVGTAHGFLRSEEEQAALVADIREKKPAVLLVALGIPAQEKWIDRHMEELRVPVFIGVGGTLDVFSGRVARAPEWYQRHGLEWLYRLAQNPKKYAKVATLPVFAWRVLTRQRLPEP